MTDVDGIVEVNARFLLVEWKHGQEIPTGQRIMFERMTGLGNDFMVLVIDGNARTGQANATCWFQNGEQRDWRDGSIDEVRQAMQDWSDWAQSDGGR